MSLATRPALSLDQIRKLQQKKYRQSLGYCLVEGEHLVLELQKAASSHPELLQAELLVTERHAGWQTSLRTHLITEKQMASLSETKSPQGIMAIVPLHALNRSLEGNERAVYLYQVQDPGNLGTILRTLGWFGGYRCLLSPGSVDPYNSKVIRASMGALFHVPIELEVEPESLSARFSRIACLDMAGEAIASPAFHAFDCYLFGNEARGVPPSLLEQLKPTRFTIPGAGLIDSLNLGTAVSLSVYESLRR